MPTVQQLPPATIVNPTDELMLSQSGATVSASIAQVVGASTNTITLSGDVTGSGSTSIITTLASVAAPGTYSKVTVNAKGLVTAGTELSSSDVTAALGYTPYSNTNPAGYVAASVLAPVATAGTYSSLNGTPTLGTMAAENASAVSITGGTISGVNLSANPITATGSATARTLAARASDRINLLDFGADPTGAGDSAPAFVAAMNAVPNGGYGSIFVPAGTYRLGSFVNQPTGRRITLLFDDGANVTGSGLGVERVDCSLGAYSLRQAGGGWFGFSPTVGSQANAAFYTDNLQNQPENSGAMRVGWDRTYTNFNYYGKYVSGIDIAEQNIFSWPNIYDNSSGWGHWEVINGPTWDEDSAARAHLSASAEHSEFDVSNNGPEAGWTYRSGQGLAVQGMSIDPWGQNGNYGGNILFAYGSVGSYDGQNGGLNDRWPSYPAVFSSGNPGVVAQNSTIVITFDVTAHGTASLSGMGGVNGVSISSGGGLYTSAPSIVFIGGGGSGAAAVPIMLGSAVVGVTVTTPGSGYSTAPTVTFTGGGVAGPSAVTVTLNTDGAHGDVASVAAAINAANIPLVRAAVHSWGGVVSKLVVFGVAQYDLGTLTLGGTALGTLGINAGSVTTPRDVSVVVFGGTGGVAVGDKLTINGHIVTVGGAGALTDVVAAINNANITGIMADINANGLLVLTCYVPQNPGGLQLAQTTGYTTLNKLSLTAGTYWPPTPPKGFATAYGELSSPVCPTTNQIAISATDLFGGSYGPVTVTLNGGDGSGWPLAVAASIQAAVTAAGWYNGGSGNLLSSPPGVLVASVHGSGGNQGLVLRNTAGGTLTLANVNGTPLQILGIAPGTYKPGGYSAGSQNVFMAAEDSIAPQGRGIFLGGASNATDRTVWPHAPAEARGSFLHGIRTDKATFDDNNALLIGASQAIAFGTGTGSLVLTNSGGALQVNGTPIALTNALPVQTSQLINNTGYLTTAAIPAGNGTLLGGGATAGAATNVAVGANLILTGGTLAGTGVASLNGRTGAVAMTSGDVTAALGYTPANRAGDNFVGAVTLNVGGALAGTLVNSGTISGGALAGSIANIGTLSGGTLQPAVLVVGTSSVDIATTTTIDTQGNPLIAATVGGSTGGQISWRLTAKSGYVQFADNATSVPSAAGADALDLQLDRSSATQVASGNRAVALGAHNTSSGTRSVAIGYGNKASGQGSVVLGQNATDNGTMGSVIFSAGYLGQLAEFQLGGISGSGTAVRLTADGNAAGTANVINLPVNQGLGGTLTVTARNVATGDMAMWAVSTLCKNPTGTVSVLSPGTTAIGPTVADSTLSGATLTVTADPTNAGLNVTVTPPSGVIVHASAVLRGSMIG
jgi:hypothetical protein